MGQPENEGKDEAPIFEVLNGAVWAIVGTNRHRLGSPGAVHEAMADHLAAVDFGE